MVGDILQATRIMSPTVVHVYKVVYTRIGAETFEQCKFIYKYI